MCLLPAISQSNLPSARAGYLTTAKINLAKNEPIFLGYIFVDKNKCAVLLIYKTL